MVARITPLDSSHFFSRERREERENAPTPKKPETKIKPGEQSLTNILFQDVLDVVLKEQERLSNPNIAPDIVVNEFRDATSIYEQGDKTINEKPVKPKRNILV